MRRFFNVNAGCQPEIHYMVDLSERLQKIKVMIDSGQYFTINRARQYGKTTILQALGEYLKNDYTVISLDFQMMSYTNFETEQSFVAAFSGEILDNTEEIPEEIKSKLLVFAEETTASNTLMALFKVLSAWCGKAEKRIVLIIDEVDSATNNQVFLDFLAQLRGYYIKRRKVPTFQSVILAGVYDIKNIRCKLRPEDDHKFNSPWNIASDFLVDMSFSAKEIAGMLEDYEGDYHTGMNTREMAEFLYDYTSGYPFLVSRLCKLIDERVSGSKEFPDKQAAWTKKGFLKAVRILLAEPNTLFDSLLNKLEDYPELNEMLRDSLFKGKEIAYVIGIRSIEMALMFGFVKISNNTVCIANRIFETLLYNFFLASPAMQQEKIYDAALKDKGLFIDNGHLNMRMILERFVEHFDSLYGDRGQQFYEEDGRRYFMLFLKPIINGTGNCYVEAETRNRERTDLVVDYHGEQFIIETKIWHGPARHMQGERQLAKYLDHYHLKKGYMLIFNFNKKKQLGVKEVMLEDKLLVEAVV
ncbi:MAG: AAA-like domain-containing protein [Eubacteriales bacterium]|nr:AAA-like domain-containing protein [Eubacteriales bacterium]